MTPCDDQIGLDDVAVDGDLPGAAIEQSDRASGGFVAEADGLVDDMSTKQIACEAHDTARRGDGGGLDLVASRRQPDGN